MRLLKQNNSNSTERRVENGRLVYYREVANADFWDKHWKGHVLAKTYKRSDQGYLGYYERPFIQYLPRQGRILEAGCGIANIVSALRARGYNAEGVDWAADTIRVVKAMRPDLPIQVGDLRKLGVKDSCYESYISLGVVEHFQLGPEEILREAHRVLVPRGIMLVSVPYFNPLRQLKSRGGLYRGHVTEHQFYQYAFSPPEFLGIVEDCGFEIVDVYPCSAAKGFKDELLPIRTLTATHKSVNAGVWLFLNFIFERQRWARQNFGHMLLVIARSLKT